MSLSRWIEKKTHTQKLIHPLHTWKWSLRARFYFVSGELIECFCFSRAEGIVFVGGVVVVVVDVVPCICCYYYCVWVVVFAFLLHSSCLVVFFFPLATFRFNIQPFWNDCRWITANDTANEAHVYSLSMVALSLSFFFVSSICVCCWGFETRLFLYWPSPLRPLHGCRCCSLCSCSFLSLYHFIHTRATREHIKSLRHADTQITFQMRVHTHRLPQRENPNIRMLSTKQTKSHEV